MFRKYMDEVWQISSTLSDETVAHSLAIIDKFAKANNRIFVAGNGGSAAIASHFVTDLVKTGYVRGAAISAHSLVDNISLFSATANDFGFENSFSWQLSQVASADDLLIVISSSGNSENIINVLKTAKQIGTFSISLTGFDGGAASKLSDLAIITPSEIGSYGPVEDLHAIFCHCISRELRKV